MAISSTLCLLLAVSLVSLSMAQTTQSTCMSRLKTCQDVYERSVYYSQAELTDYTDCIAPIDCSNDPDGEKFKMSLMDSIAYAPVAGSSLYDSGSMFSLSLVLGFVCLVLSIFR